MTSPDLRTGGLRPEVQALRAGAALMVVLYHLWPGRLPGGYVGVDVFFVISGFLITAHLLREVESTGRVRLGQFWARRARRLLPAAYVVLLASAIGVYVWIPQVLWQLNFREIVTSTLYVQNWQLASEAVDYLAADNAATVAQHYWTLSVEEQFYLIWPLLMLLAIAIAARAGIVRRAAVTGVVVVVTASSLAYSIWLTGSNASAAYFVTPARAWQFGAGALLALWVARPVGSRRAATAPTSQSHTGLPRIVLSWAGLAALAWCSLVYSDATVFPGTAAILPVAGTLAVIAAGAPSGLLSPVPLMRLRPVRMLGDTSYSLYLWHWPPIILVPFAIGHDLGFTPRLAILVGAIGAAWLTKRFIEDPIRFGTSFGLRRTSVTLALTGFAALALVATTLVGTTMASQAAGRAEALTKELTADSPRCFGAASLDPTTPCDNPALADQLVPEPADVSRDFNTYEQCWVSRSTTTLRPCTFGDESNTQIPRVALVGDSHARALLPALVGLADAGKIVVTSQLKGGCPWSTRPQVHRIAEVTRTCQGWRNNLNAWLGDHLDDIDLVVTTSRARAAPGPDQGQAQDFAAEWNTVGKRGVPVVAVLDTPEMSGDPNPCLDQLDVVKATSCSTRREAAFAGYDAQPDAVKLTTNGHLVDLTKYLCRTTYCPAVAGGVNMYRDNTHLTTTFTRTLAPYLWRELLALDLPALSQ